MTVQSTSLLAFQSVQRGLSSRQEAVYKAFERYGNMTNKQVAHELGWEINSITPRVKELREQGLLWETGIRRDPVNGRPAKVWGVARETLF